MQHLILVGLCSAVFFADQDPVAEPRKIWFSVGEQHIPAYFAKPEGDGPFPAILWLHGGRGGAVGGDPEGSAAELARAGYLTLSPMRLQGGTLSDEFRQTQEALRYLQDMAVVDNDRVAVVGFSRGGLLALMASIYLPDIRATVLLAPAAGRGALNWALGAATDSTPSTLILVAKNDTRQADHVRLSRLVERRLQRAGAPAELIIYPAFGGTTSDGHQLFLTVRPKYWNDVVAFLNARLNKANAN